MELDTALPAPEQLVEIAQQALSALSQLEARNMPQDIGDAVAGSSPTNSYPITNFAHMPREIQDKIGRYLSFSDLTSLMRTCKAMHRSIQYLTVKRIDWVLNDPQWLPTLDRCNFVNDLFRVTNGYQLAKNLAPRIPSQGCLAESDTLASCVNALAIGAVCDAQCHRCRTRLPCGISSQMFRMFTNLKDLTIATDYFKGDLDTLELPESLETLQVFLHRRTPRKDFCTSLCNLRHWRLRKLSLIDLDIHWSKRDPRLEHDGSAVAHEDDVRLPSLESLVLDDLHHMQPDVLSFLLRRWQKIKSLSVLVRLDDAYYPTEDLPFLSPTNNGPDSFAFDLSRLGATLNILKNSLVELYLICRPEKRSPYEPMTTVGLIPDLREFSSLKRLTIDPAILIGIQICSCCVSPDGTLPNDTFLGPSAVADKLPSQLEELTLMINLEQAGRIKLFNYRSDMVEGILRLRRQGSNLLRLQILHFEEDKKYADSSRCRIDFDAAVGPFLPAQIVDATPLRSRSHCYSGTHSGHVNVGIDLAEQRRLQEKNAECYGLGLLVLFHFTSMPRPYRHGSRASRRMSSATFQDNPLFFPTLWGRRT